MRKKIQVGNWGGEPIYREQTLGEWIDEQGLLKGLSQSSINNSRQIAREAMKHMKEKPSESNAQRLEMLVGIPSDYSNSDAGEPPEGQEEA